MSPDTRTRILERSLTLLRDGGSVSLESAAKEAGLTKPGLMYYFPSKRALMLGLVDYVGDRWAAGMEQFIDGPMGEAGPLELTRAYLEFALTGEFDGTDMVMFSDPRLVEPLCERWRTQMAAWIVLPESLHPDERSRLTAVRLLADGVWFARATNVFPPDPDDLDRIRSLANDILEKRSA